MKKYDNNSIEEGELLSTTKDKKHYKKSHKGQKSKYKQSCSRSRSRSRDHRKHSHKHKKRRSRSRSRSSSTIKEKTKPNQTHNDISPIIKTITNKYSTKRTKDNPVEYNLNEDISQDESDIDKQSIDHEKERQERLKRLEEIKRNADASKSQSSTKLMPVKSDTEYKKPESENIIKMSKEETQKLLKMIEQERENLEINNGDKTPDMFAGTPVEDTTELKIILNLPLFDSYEDTTGYYTPQLGEIINNQYKVIGLCGKGIFSTVVKVIDITSNIEYAIKIVRAIDIMLASGDKERSILTKFNKCDNIVRLVDSFDYKKHICMVFELYEMNLRELIKQKKQLSLEQIRIYAKQILLAFDTIHKNKLIHADCKINLILVKPDNAIINRNLTTIKVCDFGSAMSVDEVVITSDLVSRFYRAPEIFLGCAYDTKIDIWSIGCTLYELYTGKILFPGRHNNEMLKLIQQVKGKIPNKLIKRGQFSNIYFTDSDKFLSLEIDLYDKKEYIKELDIQGTPCKDLSTLIKGSNEEIVAFKDFLEKLLYLDPNKRLTALEALCHPFIMNIKY